MPLRRFAAIFLIIFLAAATRLLAATPIPFEYRDGLIWLKVALAGRSEPLNFLLDSGAGASVLDLSAARRLGLRLGARQTVQGVHSRSAAWRVEDFAGDVTGVAISASLLALDLSGPSRHCHQRIDGLLGADFFRRRIVQIDFAAQTLRLLQRHEISLAGCEIIPLSTRNDAFCARLSIDGNPPEWLRLDTGCNTSLEWVVNSRQAKQLGLATIGLNAGPVRELHTRVQLGASRIAAVKTGLHAAQMFAGESGLIGNGLLSRFTVTIDPAKRRCLLASR